MADMNTLKLLKESLFLIEDMARGVGGMVLQDYQRFNEVPMQLLKAIEQLSLEALTEPPLDGDLENQMPLQQLREEWRAMFDDWLELAAALATVPDMISPSLMLRLSHHAIEGDGPRGKAYQRDHRGVIPYKSECEWGAGVWLRVRDGLRGRPVVSVKEYKKHKAPSDWFTSVVVADRELTPYKSDIKGRAEYEAAEWYWLLNGGPKPEMGEWLERTRDTSQDVILPDPNAPCARGPADAVAPGPKGPHKTCPRYGGPCMCVFGGC